MIRGSHTGTNQKKKIYTLCIHWVGRFRPERIHLSQTIATCLTKVHHLHDANKGNAGSSTQYLSKERETEGEKRQGKARGKWRKRVEIISGKPHN